MVFTGVFIISTNYYRPKFIDTLYAMIPIILFSCLVIPVNTIIYHYKDTGVDYMLYIHGASMPIIGPMSQWFANHNILLLYQLFMCFIGYSVVSLLMNGIYQGIAYLVRLIKSKTKKA